MATAREFSLLFAPTVNSYKRFQPGSWAPTGIGWDVDNRTLGFRVVGHGNGHARREPHPRRRRQLLPRLRGDDRRRPATASTNRSTRRRRTPATATRRPTCRASRRRSSRRSTCGATARSPVECFGDDVHHHVLRPRRVGVARVQQHGHRLGARPLLRAHLIAYGRLSTWNGVTSPPTSRGRRTSRPCALTAVRTWRRCGRQSTADDLDRHSRHLREGPQPARQPGGGVDVRAAGEAYVSGEAEVVSDLATKQRIWDSGIFPYPMAGFFGSRRPRRLRAPRFTPATGDRDDAGRSGPPPRHVAGIARRLTGRATGGRSGTPTTTGSSPPTSRSAAAIGDTVGEDQVGDQQHRARQRQRHQDQGPITSTLAARIIISLSCCRNCTRWKAGGASSSTRLAAASRNVT